jgi:hypothetical protein
MTRIPRKLRTLFGFLDNLKTNTQDYHGPTAIIVGSGPSAPSLPKDLPAEAVLIAVNNAWRINRVFDYLIYPDDFPADRLPPANFPGVLVSNSGYMPAIDASGGIVFCGATMAFAAGYWAVEKIRPKILGYFASDMIYSTNSGNTHFYGNGAPDPLRKDISLGSLEARSTRLFCLALMNGTLIVNHSEEPDSRLVFPRLSTKDAALMLGYARGDLECSWRDLIAAAQQIRAKEAEAPFDALRHDYWLLDSNDEAGRFIKELDELWIRLVPEIVSGWENYCRERKGIS